MSATYPAGLVKTYGEPLALSTTIASVGIPPGYQQVVLYSPSTDFRAHFNPAIKDIVFFNSAAASGSRFEYRGSSLSLLSSLTDRDSATGSGTTLDSMLVTADFLYVCFDSPVAGFYVNVKSANSTTNTMKVEYYKNDSTWTNLSITDNTDTGASLAQDGTVTWTAVTDWGVAHIRDALETQATPLTTDDLSNTSGFWLRISFTTGGLDADTEIEEIHALSNDTNRGYYLAGVPYNVSLDRRAVGAIEAILAGGTDTLQITWSRS